jgi:hypothetical protein
LSQRRFGSKRRFPPFFAAKPRPPHSAGALFFGVTGQLNTFWNTVLQFFISKKPIERRLEQLFQLLQHSFTKSGISLGRCLP